MPEIVGATEIATYLRFKTVQTVYNYTSNDMFVPGICIGKGQYNLDALKKAIETPPYRYLIENDTAGINRNLTMVKQKRAANKHGKK